jgi:hypothetical protein
MHLRDNGPKFGGFRLRTTGRPLLFLLGAGTGGIALWGALLHCAVAHGDALGALDRVALGRIVAHADGHLVMEGADGGRASRRARNGRRHRDRLREDPPTSWLSCRAATKGIAWRMQISPGFQKERRGRSFDMSLIRGCRTQTRSPGFRSIELAGGAALRGRDGSP